MTVLIIGSGLVGTQIARLEVEREERPVVMELQPQRDAMAQLVDLDRIELVQGDVLDPFALARAIQEYNVTRIVHTAANPLLTAGAQRDPLPAIRLNVMGTTHVLEAARIFKMERVVFCSSSVLYSSMNPAVDSGTAYTEEALPRPSTIYATTKLAAENLGLNYARWYGLDFVAVRYSAVYGPWNGRGGGGEPSQLMRQLVEKALKGEEAVYRDRPSEMVYSKDAALGTALACHATGLKSRVFNITSGAIFQPDQLVRELKRVVPNARLKREEVPPDWMAAGRPPQPMDLTRARAELGYEPQFPLPKALADYVAWIRQHPPAP
ncbi:MAG: NAD(P)-dependent oxidoreductase [Chloroflexi bacterium]|nr:NAD(P)-dependent oxidoreductase [Chloroflexota bacterium]